MLKLFATKSTISVAVALVLEEIEADYELCLIDFAANEQRSYDDMRAKVPQTMGESCAYVEDVIIGPYIFGAQFTPADAHLFAITQWLAGDGVEIQNYPKLAQLQRSVAALPSVARIAEKGLL